MSLEAASFGDGVCRLLRRAADPVKKDWWERYLKGAIEFHGVPMAAIRRAVTAMLADRSLAPNDLRAEAFDVIRRPVAEEKLAGIIVMREFLVPDGGLDCRRDLPVLAELFDDGHISEWNTSDWLCVRVMGPLAEGAGEMCARPIASWVDAPGLWRRRAAGVAFVNLASRGDDFFDGFADLLIDICASNVLDSARFVQTGVGWVLRSLGDFDPAGVFTFIEGHRSSMSREAIRMAAARLPDAQRAALGLIGPRRCR